MTNFNTTTLSGIGVGLKAKHYDEVLQHRHPLDWFEVHPENYMGAGGLPHKYLTAIREAYPLSMHGVGLSLGTADGVSSNHLQQLKKVVDRYQPQLVSEHLSWSHRNGTFFNDLLPLPYNEDSLTVVINNIHKVQEALQQKILIENPSLYLGFSTTEMTETEFLHLVTKHTGCYLLLDINNIHVSANNQHYSAKEYIDNYPLHHVKEIHLAGHTHEEIAGETVLIDDHGSPVIDAVWDLFSYTLSKTAHDIPTLIEWDTNTPELSVLCNEAKKAASFME